MFMFCCNSIFNICIVIKPHIYTHLINIVIKLRDYKAY